MGRLTGVLRSRGVALFAIDLRSLALFRIALATLLLVDLASRARLLAENYSDAGAYPRATVVLDYPIGPLPSLHMLGGSVPYELGLFVVAGLAAALLALGYLTRAATAASWFLLYSLHARHPLLLDGGDDLLRALLLWCVFLPLGARWSLDARRAGPPVHTAVCSPASAALLLQVACMFFMTGLLKTGPEWADGTAISYALNRKWWILPFGAWLLAHPPLPQWTTPAVRAFEVLAPLVLFLPVITAWLRLCAILAFWGFLAGLGFGMQLNLFPWISGAGMLPFLPTLAWDALGRRFAFARRAVPTAAPAAGALRRVAALAEQAVVLALLALVLWVNAGSANGSLGPPPAVHRLAEQLMMAQSWIMYAPSPRHVDAWFEHRGKLRNGFDVDLDRATGGAGWASVKRAWTDYRFKYYLQKLTSLRWREPLVAYGQWLCRQWNLDKHGGARLDTVKLSAVITPIAIGGAAPEPPQLWELHGAPCPRE